MTEPINNFTHGGLTFNANDVQEYSTNPSTNENVILFKTGEVLTYPDQNHKVQDNQNPTLFTYKGNEYTKEQINANYNGYMERWQGYVDGKRVNLENPQRPAAPKVTLSVDNGLFYDDTYFTISEVMGATFTSSKNTVANVTLKDSENTTVDLAANDSSWYGDYAKIEGGSNNKVILDEEDKAVINGCNVTGEGTATQKDYEEE